MSMVNKQQDGTLIDSLEEAVERGADISDQHFSPGGVSSRRTRGKRREPSGCARKVSAYRQNIDYGEALFHDLVSISGEMNISLQALTKMALQEWVMHYREPQESKKEPPSYNP
jgi:hypothetical protein